MVDRTDRHFRLVMRAVTRATLLYTEMVPVGAALAGDRRLEFDAAERPLALQLGGDDASRLAEAAARAEQLGFDEVNLNCGCPSARVQAGRFGVVLMKDPPRVARCVAAMRAATSLPVTVKHRLGVDALDRYEDVERFVECVAQAGADRFIVHARKAWLRGLSPRENRTVPPLRWQWVHRLKSEHPELRIEINGGIESLDEAWTHLRAGVDGVMIGRAAYDDPLMFAGADAQQRAWSEGADPPEARPVHAADRIAVVRAVLPHARRAIEAGDRLTVVLRPLLGVVRQMPGARRFRRQLVEGAAEPGAGVEVIERALEVLASALVLAAQDSESTALARLEPQALGRELGRA